ncbi:hypothetical protein B0I29_104504 [Actinoplanes lutulentus]|uniref:Lipoprotein n=1 Tax=Actinoplanes lutulentus TaxID=1287878 RepID=A0A327ZFI1_9ACTN|nr:hypothetical protein [Actinoplanes lutulentus]RAK39962.1 hypothetical protein B0I29_104504 [Actinoplanes lutulentus]
MRTHLYAVAGLSALLLAVGGCSGGDSGTSAAPAAGAGSTAAAGTAAEATSTAAVTDPGAAADPAASKVAGKTGDAALAADTEAICAQASRTSAQFGKIFIEDYNRVLELSGQAKTDAEQKATRDVENFSYALLDMSKLAADSGLKKALAAMGDQVTALKGDLADLDDKKLAGLHATLDKACGRE